MTDLGLIELSQIQKPEELKFFFRKAKRDFALAALWKLQPMAFGDIQQQSICLQLP